MLAHKMSSFNDNISVDTGFDGLDYSYAEHQHSTIYNPARGEKYLWCAVIAQAFTDLQMKQEQDEAGRWLLRGGEDFLLVCALAGVSATQVRKSALDKITRLQMQPEKTESVCA